MSYRENSITVSLVSYLLILAYYGINWLRMYQMQGLDSATIIRLWVIVIVAGIVLNIVGNILTNIVLSIVHAIRTGSDKPQRFVEDERDRLIGLKGVQFSYIAFSLGVFLAMLSFALGQPPLIMFSLIVFFSLIAEIIGDLSQLLLYRRGVRYG
jgi:hypothetical protein